VSKKLFLNSVSSTLLYIISIVVAFVMSPVLIKALGNRDYGLWELVMSVIGYMGLLDLGIGSALVRFVALADGKDDRTDLQQTMSTALVFFLGAGCVALLIFMLLGISPGLIAGTETRDIANISAVFIFLGLDAAIMFPLQVYITVLMGLQRHCLINTTRAVITVIRAVVAFKLLYLYPGKGLIILAVLEPVFNVVQFGIFFSVLFRDREIPRTSLAAVSWAKMKELFVFGAKSAVMLIASRLQNQSVPLIIGNVIGLGSIVFFVVPNRLIDYARGFSQAIGFPIMPYFSQRIGQEDQDDLCSSWFSTTLILQMVSLPMPLFIIFCGEKFISLWIGPEYAIAGRTVLYILLVALVFDSLAVNAYRLLMAKALHGKSAAIWLALSAGSVPLGIAGAYFGGIEGVTLGTSGVTVIGSLLTLALACSAMNVSCSTYLKETILNLVIPLTFLGAALWLTGMCGLGAGYTAILIQVSVSAVVYAAAVWMFTLTRADRKTVRGHLVSMKNSAPLKSFVRSWR